MSGFYEHVLSAKKQKKVASSWITLFILVFVLSGCSAENQEIEKIEQAKFVKSEELTTFSGLVERHITGKIQSADATSLSFEVNGVVKSVNVTLGESFRKGDILASLDPKVYQLSLEQRKSEYAQAVSAKEESENNYLRNKTLRSQGLISQAVLDNAKANFDIALERANAAQNALSIAAKNAADTQLIAPYDGVVSSRLIEPSQQITPQNIVFTIQGFSKLEVSAVISESLISRVELGESVKVIVPALSQEQYYSGILSEIGSLASTGNAFPITITLDAINNKLLPGMSAELIIPVKENGAFSFDWTASVSSASSSEPQSDNQSDKQRFQIPLSALGSDGKGQYVFLLETKNNKEYAEKAYVDIVQAMPKSLLVRMVYDRSMAEDKTAGRVITAGVEFLESGQEVKSIGQGHTIHNQ